MRVKKRDGSLQELDIDKIHAVLEWACNGDESSGLQKVKGVSVSEIEMRAHLHFHDKIATKSIHECLIKAAADLISDDTPNYDQVAARLRWFAIRKDAYGQFNPPHILDLVRKNTQRKVYDPELESYYSKEEWDEINNMIDHSRDALLRYAGAEQMHKKYLAQHRKSKQIYESIQIPFILIAAILFKGYPKHNRLSYVKRYYDVISQHYGSLPTPIMAGLRTKVKQFSSCTVIDCGDSRDSISTSVAAIIDYASNKAGIGLNIGRLRAAGAPVRGGDSVSTGVIPFAKLFNAALKSVSQGGIRGASATFNYPVIHYEFENLIELKNNKGTEETRLRTVDYCVHLNRTMYERLVDGGNITFFSPEEVPDLFAAFYGPDGDFRKLYEKYEEDKTKTKRTMSAVDVFSKILTERYDTGRIYILHADHVNTNTPFYEPIHMTNLCCVAGDAIVRVDFGGGIEDIMMEQLVSRFNHGEKNVKVESADINGGGIAMQPITMATLTGNRSDIYEIGTVYGYTVRCTSDHRIYVDGKGWVEAKDLTTSDFVWTRHGQCEQVTSVSQVNTSAIPVYDITVEGTHCFFADGILVHNCEIALPTTPISSDGDGEIALCTLSAVNFGKIDNDKQMAEVCEMLVRGLDEILDYQDYPNQFSYRNVQNYRPLGVGCIGFAHWLAKNNLRWGESSVEAVDKLFHDFSYHLIKTSVQLAKEKGSTIKRTKYHDGIMPADTPEFRELAEEAKKYGIRNAVLMALMPSETSSQVSNATNGIEPPRSLITVKGNKDVLVSQVVPDIMKYGHRYQLAWDVPVQDYLTTVGAMQPYVDQAISANTTYNPHKTPVTMSMLVGDLIFAYKKGLKTLYYNNTLDEAPEEDDGCGSGGCKI